VDLWIFIEGVVGRHGAFSALQGCESNEKWVEKKWSGR